MSLLSRSYEDPIEITNERPAEEVTTSEVYISPNYKGKNPKSPEQLKAEREARRQKKFEKLAKMNAKHSGHYVSNDPAVNPNHYKSKNGLEAIDLIEAFTEELPGYEGYLAGSAMKYLCRYKKKNGLTDIKKSAWFINELISYLETGEKHE